MRTPQAADARRGAATVAALAALVAAGCGGGGGGETAATDGPAIFADSGCANCHGFDAAGANGRVGPDLDDSTLGVAAVVEKVRSGGGGMPAFDDLTDQQLEALAEYVVNERGG
jgi:mono/diheme cytochrome c family protein